jgi:hypothetical protein
VREKLFAIFREFEPRTHEQQRRLEESKVNMSPDQMAEAKRLIIDVLVDLYAVVKGEREHWKPILEAIWWKWESAEDEGFVEVFKR